MLSQHQPFLNWQSVLEAPRSRFFNGHSADTVFDRQFSPDLNPNTEANFTQSNARVLLGHAANGTLRFLALPTQVYPAPTGSGEFGLGPGMYHHFDVAMYAGDLAYEIRLDGENEVIDLASPQQAVETWYADHFIPVSTSRAGNLEIATLSFAPVAPDGSSAPLAPAPLPGPAGAFYILRVRNTGSQPVQGKIVLKAGDLVVGHYEDVRPEMRPLKQPDVTLRQNTLILSRPEGSVGIHLHEAKWVKSAAPYEAERLFHLAPGEEQVFETYLGMGESYNGVMPEIYSLFLRPALEWLNLTAAFWRERLGTLQVGPGDLAHFSQEIYIRSLFDNFNCLQTDAQGNLIAHWQGGPSHGYGTVWGIDVEPTAVSIVNICPEMARQAAIFFMTRSRAPRGKEDHSVPILVAPVIIARQWLQVSGDISFLQSHPEITAALQGIMDDLAAMNAPGETLFPSRFSSDGPVGRRYDYGTNVKVWYAFDSMAYLLENLGSFAQAAQYRQIAAEIPGAIERHMIVDGPFGLQISGGSNLGEDPGDFYLPEGFIYYDGEDTSSMLAPVYGICGYDNLPWINYHRFARSLWCANYDPEFETLYWFPSEPAVFDGTAYLSRLGGCITQAEMAEGLQNIRDRYVDLPTGSLFWWPHSDDFRRGITRCSQGQGAWAWQYLCQWLGVSVDAPSRTISFAPRGLLTHVDWQDFRAGPQCFNLKWREGAAQSTLQITNANTAEWTLLTGIRPPGTGAEGKLAWQRHVLPPNRELTLSFPTHPAKMDPGIIRSVMIEKEAAAMADPDGLLFKRFGPAMLWGHWEGSKLWDFSHLPLTLRFLILNATGKNFERMTVSLIPQDGWQVQSRRVYHWDRPDKLGTGTAAIVLDGIPSPEQATASFWVSPPEPIQFAGSFGSSSKSAHAPSQPEQSVCIYAQNLTSVLRTTFRAQLEVLTRDGEIIRREIEVPVSVLPA